MRDDNPVKEIGRGERDSPNTYHTPGTTKLTIYRQMHVPLRTPFPRLKSNDSAFTNPHVETLDIQSSKQDNET